MQREGRRDSERERGGGKWDLGFREKKVDEERGDGW